jgi:beta-N-acetylhexosaminidase
MTRSRAIYGCAGTSLSAEERAFFREAQPWGFILFARNVADPAQVRSLVSSLRETVGDEKAPMLIDQEGGRVARLKPPHWKVRPPPQRFGDLYRENADAGQNAAYLNARLIAEALSQLGINVDCVPVLDLPAPGADAVIGDRAFSSELEIVIALGWAVIDGMLDGGVLPVMKHIPGHGRATADSHLALPRVSTPEAELRAADFAPFRALSDCPMAMTAHVVYEAIDALQPATTSARIIGEVIRRDIGFGGLLMSDDLSMKALGGSFAERSRAALSAGCDILLHCNGRMDEMVEVAREAGALDAEARARSEKALAHLRAPKPFDGTAAEANLAELMGATV